MGINLVGVEVAPTLSIVIPTRNRYNTLRVVIAYLLSWKSNDFEVVVEDNTDDSSELADFVLLHSADPRFSYAHSPAPRSMVENCERAVRRAKGKVLTVIGDDDSVTECAVDAACWMMSSEIEALVCGVSLYTWPDMEHAIAINRGYNGKLIVGPSRGDVKIVDARGVLDKVARSGAQNLTQAPRLYQALVQREVVERIFADIGTCFPGPVPDMSSAIALCKYARRCAVTDIPLIVAGQSRSSMSGRNSVRKHQGDIRGEESLPADVAEHWDRRIPRYWSAPTIWAETALKAAEQTGQVRFEEKFSFARVYAACIAYNDRRYLPLVSDAMRHSGALGALLLAPRVGWYLGVITWQRAVNLGRKFFFGFPGEPFEDVALATKRVEQMIDESGLLKKMLRNSIRRGQV